MKTSSTPFELDSLRSYDDLPGRVHLHLALADSTKPVIVEGISDSRALSRVVTGTSIFPAGDRKRVLEAALSLMDIGDTQFWCVFDLDFHDEPFPEILTDWCYPYPSADLEATLLDLGMARELVEGAVSAERLDKCGGPELIVESAQKGARQLALLRTLDARHKWSLPFSAVSPTPFISEDGDVDLETYARKLHFRKASQSEAYSEIEAIEDIVAAIDYSEPTRGYRGRDFLSIILKLLTTDAFKAKSGLKFSFNSLEYSLMTGAAYVIEASTWGKELRNKVRF